jgi:hypothetical protein
MTDSNDEAWLLARQRGEPAEVPVDDARQASYGRLENLIAQLPEVEPPAGWQARAFQALPLETAPSSTVGKASNRRRLIFAALAAGLVAVAVGAWQFQKPAATHLDRELWVEVIPSELIHRGTVAQVGDVLNVSSSVATDELRLYRADGSLVARCRGASDCVASQTQGQTISTLAWKALAPGRYRAVSLRGAPIPEPTGDGLEADLQAADAAGIVSASAPPIEIQ